MPGVQTNTKGQSIKLTETGQQSCKSKHSSSSSSSSLSSSSSSCSSSSSSGSSSSSPYSSSSRHRSKPRERSRQKQRQKIINGQPKKRVNNGYLKSILFQNTLTNRKMDQEDISRAQKVLGKDFKVVAMTQYLCDKPRQAAESPKQYECSLERCQCKFGNIEELQKHIEQHRQQFRN